MMKNSEISQSTLQKALQVKKYIQKKYNLNKISQEQQLVNWHIFQQKVKQLNLTIQQKQQTKNRILHTQMQQLRRKRQKVSKKNFQSISIIGRGAFGQVRLCRQKGSGRMVAIKCLKKKQMIKKNQQVHLKAERNILADGGEWMVSLLYSFQDQNYLYLVMDYMGGGDLMNVLIQRNVIAQSETKFYAAQIVLAIQSIHQKQYIHRDLKPDNVLIDHQGHIKLTDFGLSKHIPIIHHPQNQDKIITISHPNQYKPNQQNQTKGSKRRKLAFSAVGTPDYIAPQMLKRMGYNEMVDWWALGVMIYEMIIGYAPFSSDSNEETYYKIENHDDYLYFPPEVEMSFEVIDLISRLLSHQDIRLGKNGSQQIKSHKWFKDINWNEIKKMKPPFIPELQSKMDTKYFDKYDELEPWINDNQSQSLRKDFNFIGYTFKMQKQENKDIIKQEIQKLQKIKEQQRKKPKPDMKKKKIIVTTGHPQEFHSKPLTMTPKLLLTDYIHQSQIQTDRSKTKKSKSPLQLRDTNRLKTKQSVSKSPLKIQNGEIKQRYTALGKKIGFQGLINSIAQGGELNKTLTLRKSLKTNK